jgi:hypothetical protein
VVGQFNKTIPALRRGRRFDVFITGHFFPGLTRSVYFPTDFNIHFNITVSPVSLRSGRLFISGFPTELLCEFLVLLSEF